MADTPFDTYGFAATGGSTLRTMPARLHDVINVLDYGADPTGSVDCTTNIQAAINAALVSGSTNLSGSKGGLVFFPPGSYLVNGGLTTANVSNQSASFLGCGHKVSKISGTYNAGWIITCGSSGFEETASISGLGVTNLSTTAGTGAVRVQLVNCVDISNCEFSGVNGVTITSDTFNSSVRNCVFTGAGAVGSIGLDMNQCGAYNCQFSDWDIGLQVSHSGATGPIITGCKITSCRQGISLGPDSQVTAYAILGCTISDCDYGLYVSGNGANYGLVAGLSVSGTSGVANAKPQYGIYANLMVGVFESCSVTAECDQYGIYCNDYNCTFINTTSTVSPGSGSDWRMPVSNPFAWGFINCNNPPNVGVFSDLTAASSTNEGAVYDISNASIASDGPGGGQWGGTVTAGGTTHARVRSNGSKWSAVGV